MVFHVNQRNSKENIRYRVLATILYSVPPGTTFGGGYKNLDRRLARVLRGRKHPIITSNFSVYPYDDISPEIDELLHPQRDYGVVIGLENIGSDFNFRVTQRTHDVAKEIERLGVLSCKDIKYLNGLGKKLMVDNS